MSCPPRVISCLFLSLRPQDHHFPLFQNIFADTRKNGPLIILSFFTHLLMHFIVFSLSSFCNSFWFMKDSWTDLVFHFLAFSSSSGLSSKQCIIIREALLQWFFFLTNDKQNLSENACLPTSEFCRNKEWQEEKRSCKEALEKKKDFKGNLYSDTRRFLRETLCCWRRRKESSGSCCQFCLNAASKGDADKKEKIIRQAI